MKPRREFLKSLAAVAAAAAVPPITTREKGRRRHPVPDTVSPGTSAADDEIVHATYGRHVVINVRGEHCYPSEELRKALDEMCKAALEQMHRDAIAGRFFLR